MKNKRISTVLYAVGGAAVLTAAVLQAVAFSACFDALANYFVKGAILPKLAIAFAIAGGLFGVIAALLSPKAEGGTLSPLPTSVYSALPLAVGFVALAIALFLSGQATERSAALRVPTALLALAAAAYAILSALPNLREKYRKPITLLGFTAPLACALANAYYYFDLSVEMNSPVKYCVQTALLFSMLYFLGELRYLIGEPKPRLFCACTLLTLAAASLCVIAFPVASFTGAITRADYVIGAYLVLGIIFRAVTCTLPLILPAPPTEPQKEDDTNV